MMDCPKKQKKRIKTDAFLKNTEIDVVLKKKTDLNYLKSNLEVSLSDVSLSNVSLFRSTVGGVIFTIASTVFK